MQLPTEEIVQALVGLGFTGLEAEVYCVLVQESPTTGYKIAQALGKPVANTYKAIESLMAKGAVLVDDGASRLCRAVPPDELLTRLDRSFSERRALAAEALARLRAADADDRVYQMRSVEQVFERARMMLARAGEVVLLDAFPEPIEALRAEIEEAAARGVTVAIKAYAECRLEGVDVLTSPEGRKVRDRWPGQWLNLVADGSEHLISLLSPDGRRVYQAIWSGSVYLSWVYHSAVSSELLLASVQRALDEGETAEDVRLRLTSHRKLRALEAPGYRALLARFGAEQPAAAGAKKGRKR